MLAELCAVSFREAYAGDTVSAEMEEHIATRFNLAAIEQDLRESVYLLAECEGRVAGYVCLNQKTPPECLADWPGLLQISRFYLRSEWYGRGVAQELMAACRAELVKRKAQTLWLMVWSQNRRAQRFYQKCGFRQVGFASFRFANRIIEDDWVMVAE